MKLFPSQQDIIKKATDYLKEHLKFEKKIHTVEGKELLTIVLKLDEENLTEVNINAMDLRALVKESIYPK